ncbi:MAG: hypothetical protein M1822_000356 [Bathelium mastoideum]|nr:MAG: hypothetical protein M1822_000356 [Bathelium mastoideum]
MYQLTVVVLLFFNSLLWALPTPVPPTYINQTSPEVFAKRDYFYVGGRYVNATQPQGGKFGTSGTYMVDQLYVEQLVPQNVKQKYPLVFWHGAAQTGTGRRLDSKYLNERTASAWPSTDNNQNWLNTPDGREGWASYFLRQGYTVYIIDQPQRGRSAWLPDNTPFTIPPTQYIEEYFTTVQNFNLWPQAKLHTQWPGSGIPGEDPAFDTLYASQVQLDLNVTESEANNRLAGAALLDRIGPAVIITHSQAGPYGFGIGEVRPQLVKGIIAIEPAGPPIAVYPNTTAGAVGQIWGVTTLPATYAPAVASPADLNTTVDSPIAADLVSCVMQTEPVRRLVNLAQFPVVVMTSEAGYHAQYDYCTAAWLSQAGVDAEWLNLPAVGVHGNSHFVFMEKNSLEIAGLAQDWLKKKNLYS